MKNKSLLFCLLMIGVSSCAPIYYQVHTIVPESPMVVTNDRVLYEDVNCTVVYDFWTQEGGDAGFWIYNKTDKNIRINLDESFFVKNEVAHNYYQNKVLTFFESRTKASSATRTRSASTTATFVPLFQDYTASIGYSAGISVMSGVTASSGEVVSYVQEKTIIIPPKAVKRITGYIVNKDVFDTTPLSFSKDSSPIIFENHISYQIGRDDEPRNIINKFYVSKITEHRERELMDTRAPQKQFKATHPDRFFIKYKVVSPSATMYDLIK